MALRKTFAEIVDATINEARLSTATSRGIDHRDHVEEIVKRNYYMLCEEFDSWQHLELKRDATGNRKVLQAGSRYYDWPTNLNPLKVTEAWVKWGSVWMPVTFGITYMDYSISDPSLDQRSDPILQWDYYGGTQFEVWPFPNSDGVADGNNEIAFVGQKLPEQVTGDNSRLDMDDIVLQLLSAAEILNENQSKNAETKGQLAQRRLWDLQQKI